MCHDTKEMECVCGLGNAIGILVHKGNLLDLDGSIAKQVDNIDTITITLDIDKNLKNEVTNNKGHFKDIKNTFIYYPVRHYLIR